MSLTHGRVPLIAGGAAYAASSMRLGPLPHAENAVELSDLDRGEAENGEEKGLDLKELGFIGGFLIWLSRFFVGFSRFDLFCLSVFYDFLHFSVAC